MNNQNLIIYDFPELFKILDELKNHFNFEIINTSIEQFSKIKLDTLSSYLIISKNELPNIKNQFIFENLPIRIFTLIENLNNQK